MLLVIFGAGASYDSNPRRPPMEYGGLEFRPPLANELFDDRPFMSAMINSFERCQPVIPYLYKREGFSVERELQSLQEQASNNPVRHKQLAAVRYYLHAMLWDCMNHWVSEARGVTNYKTLLDQITHWRSPDEKVCLVTFNYDTMLEQALPSIGIQINTINDYIDHPKFQLIKVHGSIDWGRQANVIIENIDQKNDWAVAKELIEKADNLSLHPGYQIVKTRPIGKVGSTPFFPAIAIPLERKSEYECPAEHLNALNEFLPGVTKILVIGWSATEEHFLRLLPSIQMKNYVRVLTVAGSPETANEVNQRINHHIGGIFENAKSGFTQFVVTREAEKFLRS